MVLTLAVIGGVVAAVAKYLLANKGAETVEQKALEKVGEMGGEALVNAGKNAFTSIKQALTKRGEAAKKATKALVDVEEDPTDQDYQQKLATELQRLAAGDPELNRLLEKLGEVVQQAQTQIGGDVQGSVNVADQGKIYGPTAAVNTGAMSGTYTFNEKDDRDDAKGNAAGS